MAGPGNSLPDLSDHADSLPGSRVCVFSCEKLLDGGGNTFMAQDSDSEGS